MAGVGRLLVGPGALRPRAKDQPASLLAVRPRLRQHGHAGLNKGEASNSVRRAVFFHRQGEIRDRPDQQARHPDNQIIGPSEKDHLEPAIGSRRVRASGNAAAQRAAIAQNPCAPKRSKIGPQASVRRAVAIPMPTVP